MTLVGVDLPTASLRTERVNWKTHQTQRRLSCALISCADGCPKGDSCSFAHCNEDLRVTEGVYKTQLCHFFQNGYCKKGDRCKHAHGERDLRRTSSGTSLHTPSVEYRINSIFTFIGGSPREGTTRCYVVILEVCTDEVLLFYGGVACFGRCTSSPRVFLGNKVRNVIKFGICRFSSSIFGLPVITDFSTIVGFSAFANSAATADTGTNAIYIPTTAQPTTWFTTAARRYSTIHWRISSQTIRCRNRPRLLHSRRALGWLIVKKIPSLKKQWGKMKLHGRPTLGLVIVE